MVEFLGVGVQHVPGALGRYRGKRCIRCRLAARRPVLAGACAEPAVLPVGIYSDLALRVRPVQGDAMLLQGGHSLLRGMPVSVVGPHTEKGTSGRRLPPAVPLWWKKNCRDAPPHTHHRTGPARRQSCLVLRPARRRRSAGTGSRHIRCPGRKDCCKCSHNPAVSPPGFPRCLGKRYPLGSGKSPGQSFLPASFAGIDRCRYSPHKEFHEVEVTTTNDDGDTETVAKTVLTIEITHKTAADITQEYHFNRLQNKYLDLMIQPNNQNLWA